MYMLFNFNKPKVMEKTNSLIKKAIKLAILEAKKGYGKVSPNPPVGCVIIKENKILSSGYHAQFGKKHAEVDAISKLSGDELKNATIITTLEPCSHEGKTPSCAKLISKLPIKHLIYGIKDTNPTARGGALIIKNAGIKVTESPYLQEELTDLVEIFRKNQERKSPFVSIKAALTLDGYMADKYNKSKWITEETTRKLAHTLRKQYDATMIGVNTFIEDNPKLNIRLETQEENNIVVIDPKARVVEKSVEKIKQSNLYKLNKKIFWVVSNTQNLPKLDKLEYIVFKDCKTLLATLYQKGIYSILIEGGAKTFSHFFEKNLVDRAYLFFSNKIIGDGLNLLHNISRNLENPITLKRITTTRIENTEDTLITGLIAYGSD